MGNLVLKGHISYATKRKYKWVAEFGKNTCEKCAALHGQEFEEDDVPYWPHPNCRCKVEEISVVDEIESEINEYKEEIEKIKLQANELLGDTRVLRKQIEKLIKEAHSKEANSLEGRLTRLEYEVYKLIDKIESLTCDTIDKYEIEKMEKIINELKQISLKKLKEAIDKSVETTEDIRSDLHDGAGFWHVSSSPDTLGKEYLKNEDAKIVKTLNDLESQNLKDFVSKKLESQKMSQNIIGVTYDKNSSVAKAISNSQEFKTFISKNKIQLAKERSIKDNYLAFGYMSNLNLYLAINHSDIIDIHLDSNNTLHAKVIDTYDFNEGESNPIIAIPRVLQKNDIIIPHYSITKIEIPESIWMTY